MIAGPLFLLVLPLGAPARWTLPATAVANALVALPFAIRTLEPALARARADHGALAASPSRCSPILARRRCRWPRSG